MTVGNYVRNVSGGACWSRARGAACGHVGPYAGRLGRRAVGWLPRAKGEFCLVASKTKTPKRMLRGLAGGSDRRRSGDLSIFSRTLYQLSYRAKT